MSSRIFLYPEDMPAAAAAARCLALLTNSEFQALRSQSGGKDYADICVLILDVTADENRISLLAAMRRNGFRGPAVLLSRANYGVLMLRHPILKFGADSHEVCQVPWNLDDILARLRRLRPVQDGNMDNLKAILTGTESRLKRELERMSLTELRAFMESQVFATHVDVQLDAAPAMPLRDHAERLLDEGRPEPEVAARIRRELIRLFVNLGYGVPEQ